MPTSCFSPVAVSTPGWTKALLMMPSFILKGQ